MSSKRLESGDQPPVKVVGFHVEKEKPEAAQPEQGVGSMLLEGEQQPSVGGEGVPYLPPDRKVCLPSGCMAYTHGC